MATPAAVLAIMVEANTGQANAALSKTDAQLRSTAAAAKASSSSMASSFTAAGKKMQTAGKSMTKFITLPAIGIGVAAVKMSTDFNSAMTLIATQAGASRKEVKNLHDAVLDLAASGKVEQGPKDLADALFHIESQGFRAADAMKVLKTASQGADVGGAELEGTAQALGAALNGLRLPAKDAKKVMSQLNAIVGAGDLRMEELTGALSTGLLPAARNVGLELKDVGAALAVLARSGVPAQAGATRLRMSFSLMAAPTAAAKEALHGIGLEATDLASTMRHEGLPAAVALLRDHLDGLSKVGRTQVLSEAFGGAKSGATIAALIQNVDKLDEAYKNVGPDVDKFNKALATDAQTASSKFSTAWAQAQAVLVRLGERLTPAVTAVLSAVIAAVQDVSKWFSKLDPDIQKAIVAFGLLVIAAGPILTVLGGIAIAIGAISAPVAAVVLGIGALVGAFVVAYKSSQTFRDAISSVGDSARAIFQDLNDFSKSWLFTTALELAEETAKRVLPAIAEWLKGFAHVVQGVVEVITGILTLDFAKVWDGLKHIFGGIFDMIVGTLRAVTAPVRSVMAKIGGAIGDAMVAAKDLAIHAIDKLLGGFTTILDGAAKVADGMSHLPGPIGDAWDKAQGALEGASDSINGVRESLRGANPAVENTADHVRNLDNILRKLRDHPEKTRKAFSVLGDLFKPLIDQAKHWLDVVDPLLDLFGINIGNKTKKARDDANRHGQGMANDAKKNSDKVWKEWDTKLDRLVSDGSVKGDHFKKAIGRSYQDMNKISQGAAQDLLDATNVLLKGLGVDPISFGAKKDKPKSPHGGGAVSQTVQTGGWIVPGYGEGDKVPAMLEPGEFVWNKKAVKQAGPVIQAWNDKVPRFAKGGIVQAGELAQSLGLSVSGQSHFGGTPTSGHVAGSYHYSDQAIDASGAAGTMRSFFLKVFKGWLGHGLAEEFYDPMGYYVKNDQRVSGAIGGHSDHVHVAILGAALGALGDMAGVGAAAPKLKDITLSGPAGALLGMGQGAVDKVHDAAQKYLDKHAGAAGGFGSVANGPVQQMAKEMVLQMWNAGQWPPFESLEMAEAGWDMDATNASSGAYGLPQALPASKLPPAGQPGAPNGPEKAKAQLGWMMNYIKGRYGDPAGAWSFHQANNWYQQGGMVGMKAGGDPVAQLLKKAKKGKPINKVMEKLKKLKLDPDLEQKKNDLTEEWNTYQEYADNAAGDPSIVEAEFGLPVQGWFKGQQEGFWLTEEFKTLGKLRELLIKAEVRIDAAKKQLSDAIEKIRQRIEVIKKKKLPPLKEQLKGIKGNSKSAKEARKVLQNQIKALTEESGTLQEKVIPALTGQQSTINDKRGEVLSALSDVQGAGGPLESIDPLTTGDVINRFGGQLRSVALRLLELDTPVTASTGSGDSAVGDLYKQMAEDWQKRYVVSQAQYGVFSDFFGSAAMANYGGMFATGGFLGAGKWGIAGESGAEVVHGPAQVTPLGGTPIVNVHVDPFSLETTVETIVGGVMSKTVSKARRRTAA